MLSALETFRLLPAWTITRESYNYEPDGKTPYPTEWGISFQACVELCAAATPTCAEFAFTNANWHGPAGKGTACSLTHAPVGIATPCTTGSCRNWDTFDCSAGSQCGPPPAPAPGPPPAPAATAFATVLADHMVLQREEPIEIWGVAAPNSTITLTMTATTGAPAQTVRATINAATTVFSAIFDARPASSVPATITLSSSVDTHETVPATLVLSDVLIGDVWGCHGQSNMAFGLGQDINATAECAAAGDADSSLIRIATFSSHKPWAVATPTTACTGTGFSPFSAVCWYFGKNVFQHLNRTIPIGLLSSNVGGTAVERWSGPDALAKCNQTGVVQQSNLWTPYIVPLLPLQMSGWIWYQAESNVACATTWPWSPGGSCARQQLVSRTAHPRSSETESHRAHSLSLSPSLSQLTAESVARTPTENVTPTPLHARRSTPASFRQ